MNRRCITCGEFVHEYTPPASPTHWKVRVKLGTAKLPQSRSRIPQSLKVVFRQVLYTGMYGYISPSAPTQAEFVFDKLRTAQTQATMASSAGLDVRLTPCVLVELPDIGGEDARTNAQTISS